MAAPLLALALVADGTGYGGDIPYLVTTTVVASAFSVGCLWTATPGWGLLSGAGPGLALALASATTAGLLVSILRRVADAGLLVPSLTAAATAFVVLLVLRARGLLDDERAPTLWLLVAALAGLAARGSSILALPFAAGSDMLPLVESALTRFFDGAQPYGVHEIRLPGREPYPLPLTYLPLQWLVYAPAHLAGVDLRWTNLVVEAGLAIAALGWLQWARPRLTAAARWALVTTFGAWSLNGYLTVRQDAEILPFVGLLVALGAALGAGRARTAWALLAAALATNPLAAVVAPYVAVHDATRRGVGRAVASACGALAVTSLLVLPFALDDMAAFRSGVWEHWRKVLHNSPEWANAFQRSLGFSVWLYRIRDQDALWLAQGVACFGLFALCVARRWEARPAGALAFAAWTLYAFLALNVVVWGFLFLPAAALALVAFAQRCAAPGAESARAQPARRAAGEPWRRPLASLSAALGAGALSMLVIRVLQPPVFDLFLDARAIALLPATATTSLTCPAGGAARLAVRVENRGSVALPPASAGRVPLHLGYRLFGANGRPVAPPTAVAPAPAVPAARAPGEAATGEAWIEISCRIPAGRYMVNVALVQGDVWQDRLIGAPVLSSSLHVEPAARQ